MIETVDRLKREKAAMRDELKLRNDELRALKFTIVATIGGTDYEGFPTSEINYLQRLRILLEKESQLESTSRKLKECQEDLEASEYNNELLRKDRHALEEANRKMQWEEIGPLAAKLTSKDQQLTALQAELAELKEQNTLGWTQAGQRLNQVESLREQLGEQYKIFDKQYKDRIVELEQSLSTAQQRILLLEQEVQGLVSHRYQLADEKAKAEQRVGKLENSLRYIANLAEEMPEPSDAANAAIQEARAALLSSSPSTTKEQENQS